MEQENTNANQNQELENQNQLQDIQQIENTNTNISNNNEVVFHVKDYNSDEESVWSDSSDDELDRAKVKEMYEKEMRMNKRLGEEEHIGEDNYKSKNEVLYQEKVKKLKEITESAEERQKRFGITLNDNEVMIKIGEIAHIMDDTVIIQSCPPEARQEDNGIEKMELNQNNQIMQQDVLDLDNIIFDQNKEIIGTVEDVIGSVKSPLYQILTDKYLENLINDEKLKNGDPVFVVQGLNKILLKVQINQLMKQKGCDASNQNDEEILQDNDKFFSDDEQEQQNNPKLKNQKRKMRQEDLEEETDNLEGNNNNEGESQNQKQNQNSKMNSKNKFNNKNQNLQENQSQQNQNQNPQKKKIMLFKMVNGKMEKVFVKPSQFEKIKNDPKNKIQTYSNLNELPVNPFENNNQSNNNRQNQNKPQFNNRQQQHNFNRHQNQQKLNMMFPQVDLMNYNQNQYSQNNNQQQQQNIFSTLPNFNNNTNNNNNNNNFQQQQQYQTQQFNNNSNNNNQNYQNYQQQQGNQNTQSQNSQNLNQNNLQGMSVEQLQQLAQMANQLASQKQQNQ